MGSFSTLFIAKRYFVKTKSHLTMTTEVSEKTLYQNTPTFIVFRFIYLNSKIVRLNVSVYQKLLKTISTWNEIAFHSVLKLIG